MLMRRLGNLFAGSVTMLCYVSISQLHSTQGSPRRMSRYDEPLLRPTFMARMIRIARRFMRSRKNALIEEGI